MATSRLTTTHLTFTSDGTDINARIIASDDTLTLFGSSGIGNAVSITNLKTPVLPTDAVTKAYVDGLVTQGVTWKNSANVATTVSDMTNSTYSTVGLGTITWVGVPTIDGEIMANGYRVVVKNNAATNGTNSQGIYTVTTDVGNLVLTRSDDASAGFQTNGSAIFVFSGLTNNDKAYVVTNDTPVDWDGGVIWSVMSSVPAVVIGGSDTQIQYNDTNSLGANASFTYNKNLTTPILSLGSSATGLTTFNLGTSTFPSSIISVGTGLFTLSGSGATTLKSTSANLTLQADTSGNIILDTATNDWTFNSTTLSSQAAAVISSTNANLTLQAATSGNVIIDTATNDWTFNSTTLSSQAAATISSTSANLTLQAATSGNVIIDTATNDWTFNSTTLSSQAAAVISSTSANLTLQAATSGNIIIDTATNDWTFNSTTLSSQAAAIISSTSANLTLQAASSGNVIIDTVTNDWTFNGPILSSETSFTTQAAATSNVSLFETTTSGTITLGNSTGGTGAITINGLSSNILIGSTTTGNIQIGSGAVPVGSFDGTNLTIGSTSTTVLNLRSTGTSGAVNISAGNSVTSGTVSLSTTTATTATVSGGEIDLTAGDGNTSGSGGTIDLNAGNGGTSGTGGSITLNAGNGGASSGSGGNVLLQGGSAAAVANAGNVVLKIAMAGTSTATNNIIEFQNNAGSQIGRMNNDGNMYAVSFVTTSDVKYKTNIEKLNSSLDKINQIEGYSYNWKNDFVGYNNKLQYGVIAQQLEDVGLGHLVENTENSKAVNYIGLIPLLIEAIKELSKKLEK